MQDEILSALRRRHEYISGEDLSSQLGVSRQALWKHIQGLKEAGYDIVAVPHLGYRLEASPDRLYPAEISWQLQTRSFGKTVHYYDELASTMDTAEELALSGAAEGTLVVAEAQTRGRGRMGRDWVSPKYQGIYCSLILRPRIAPAATPVLTLLAGVSVVEALAAFCHMHVSIKWPNDILLHARKLAGILTEMQAETDSTHFVIIGIGINANTVPGMLPREGISLQQELKRPVERAGVLRAVLERLEHNYGLFLRSGPRPITEAWSRHSSTLGSRVRVAGSGRPVEGEAVGVDDDGALLVRTDAGILRRIAGGDVTRCR